MAQAVAVERRDDALILTLRNGPSNALTAPLRAALIDRIANAAPCSRIILAGAGPAFCSALALEPDAQQPTLAELCLAVEHAPAPVIALLSGVVLGAGAELALAARGRIATPAMRFAMAEIALGLCPEGGSTRRLPHLVGTERALDLLLSGRPVAADEALSLGLVDQVSPAPMDAALALTILPMRPSLVQAAPAAIVAARRATQGALPAARRLVACVEAAALLPPEAHLAFEAVARDDLEASPEASALRAVARAERRAAVLPPAVARQTPRGLARLALSGQDPALAVLAEAALDRGLTVVWRTPALPADLQARAAGRLLRLEAGVADSSDVQVHAADSPPFLRRAEDGIAHLVLGGAEGDLGLALAPKGRLCELALPADERGAAAATGVAVSGLRHLGWQVLLVGRQPVLGRRMARAGQAALDRLRRDGWAEAALEDALTALARADGAAPPSEVVARWLAALANEGLRLLDQGVARRPSDIDLAMVLGQGFPRWRGGPMHLADRRGLMALRRDLRTWAADDPLWSPAPLLDRLIQDGLRLSALDGA